MTTAYVGIGSNISPRKKRLEDALAALASTAGVTIRRVSPLYETDPVGGPKQGRFLNGVVALATQLPPRALLDALRAIEKRPCLGPPTGSVS
jgi:2-amino-4-hydroxy-6-hydroxymethyldihydropteridine diphosphokinase